MIPAPIITVPPSGLPWLTYEAPKPDGCLYYTSDARMKPAAIGEHKAPDPLASPRAPLDRGIHGEWWVRAEIERAAQ